MLKFLFDLDGTLTRGESLIAVVRAFGLDESIAEATRRACVSSVGYRANFEERVRALGHLRAGEVAEIIAAQTLRPGLESFVKDHAPQCAIVSSNLDCWCAPLVRRLGCQSFLSKAKVTDGRVTGITEFLDKAAVVSDFRRRGFRTVYIGDGANDLQAMKEADISVAISFSENPCAEITRIADYAALSENELLSILENLTDE